MTSLMPYTDPTAHPTLPLPEILANQLTAANKLDGIEDEKAKALAESHRRVASMISDAMARNRAEREAWKTPRKTELL